MMGAAAIGAKSAGIYITNGPSSCAYVAGHCRASIIFTENEEQVNRNSLSPADG
jgi:long-subunit acyl-CoA synthetase (AMP-forming)